MPAAEAPSANSLAETLSPRAAGQAYFEFRAVIRNNEGLTKTYNRFHHPSETSPDILKLREMHSAMDRAVLDAYGWTDLKPTCEFPAGLRRRGRRRRGRRQAPEEALALPLAGRFPGRGPCKTVDIEQAASRRGKSLWPIM
jgi:hypothetical protein